MTHTTAPLPMPQRLLAPDLARGMMLLLIAVANVSAYLWNRPSSGFSLHPEGGSALDQALSGIVMLFVDARVYPMFAFLFGYGIMQFTMSRLERGIEVQRVSRMLLRRHVWLIVFGFVHALLLFAGDILGAYGLTGLAVAAVLLRASERAMRLTLWILGGVTAGMMLFGAIILLAFDAIFPAELLAASSAESFEMPDAMPDFSVGNLFSGIESWWVAALVRVGVWIVSTPTAVLSLIVPFCVLLGGYAGRHRWLEGLGSKIRFAPVALIGVTVAVLAALPAALAHWGVLDIGDFAAGALFIISQVFGVAGGVGYVALFALIAGSIGRRKAQPGPLTRAVAAVGQRSLSFYLLQSLVFAPLLSAWAFGLGAQIGTSIAYAIALGVWILSLIIATILDRAGKRGPAETLLRKLTYGRDVTTVSQPTA